LETLKNKKIAVLMGGISSEREISLLTGKAVLKALKQKGFNAMDIDIDRNAAESIKKANPDIAFIALHGTFGEDGAIQGILEYAGIPYTGSGVLGSSIAFDKLTSKAILMHKNIPTPEYKILDKQNTDALSTPPFMPCVVKPPNQGSSIGIGIVRKTEQWAPALEEAFKYSDEILVERFIDGKLLAIGVKPDKSLPIVHIEPKSGFYDYEAKYTVGKTEYHCPADLDEETTKICAQVSLGAYRALNARGFARVDVILDEKNTPYVLELNTIPGMTPTSLLPMAAKKDGLEFDDLVQEIVSTAQLDNQGNQS
jgi:D-alanine-D-alanine ligase